MDTQVKTEINDWNADLRSGPLKGLCLAGAVIGVLGGGNRSSLTIF